MNRIAARELINRHANRRSAAKIHGINAIGLSTETDPTHIAQADQPTIFCRAEHDVGELLLRGQSPLELNGEGELLTIGRRWPTHLARRNQAVLTLELIHHIR